MATSPRNLARTLLRPAYHSARNAKNMALDFFDTAANRRPPMVPPRRLLTIGQGDFIHVGNTFVQHFVRLAQLTPDSRVLDVGCGCGRMARALTAYLNPHGPARYEGFDINREFIAWTTREITTRHPNFRFQLSDIHNQQYNPQGRIKPQDYAFPYPDASFDLVVLTSVFTHMRPGDVEHYLAEISRVLVRGGRCFATYFVINPASAGLIAGGKSTIPLNIPHDGFFAGNPDLPEASVGYEEAAIRAMVARAGMEIVDPIHFGNWCGRTQFVDYQDIIVSRAHLAQTIQT